MSPTVPASRCIEPGCGEYAAPGRSRCARHVAALDSEWHAGEHRRVYMTSRWARVSRRILAERPICANCQRRLAVAVDHRTPLREMLAAGRDPYDPNELDALCASCHAAKTAREVGLGGAPP